MTSHPGVIPRAAVPCNGCKACCKTLVILQPEEGDDPSRYLHTKIITPYGEMLALAKKPGSKECSYLGDDGCTIWDSAPAICRIFDCRVQFARYSRKQRKQMLKKGYLDEDVMVAGRERLHTLDPTPFDLDMMSLRGKKGGGP